MHAVLGSPQVLPPSRRAPTYASPPGRQSDPPDRKQNPQTSVPAGQRQLRVLWIDDEPDVIGSQKWRLERQGVVVDVAYDVATGLERARSRTHDVLIIDYRFPSGVSGIDLLRRLRQEGIATPAILLTGHGSEAVAFETGQLGSTRYMTKPLDPEQFVASVWHASRMSESPEVSSRPLTAHYTAERHPYSRWATAVVCLIAAEADPRTEACWAREAGMSLAALRNLCSRVHLSARRSLLLGRLLRALVQARSLGGSFEDFLDADSRTVEQLVVLAGCEELESVPPLDFVRRQHLITESRAIAELIRRLHSRE